MVTTNSTNNGVGIGTVLFLIFLVLKLCKVITWSWWWVTAPIWIPLGIALIFFAIAGIIYAFTK